MASPNEEVRGTQEPAPKRPTPLRRIYDWVLHWADTRHGTPALFALAFAEASFFPIPPDVLLMPLALSRPRRAAFYAAVATAGSVLGGIAGYFVGRLLWERTQAFFYAWVFSPEVFARVTDAYTGNAFWTVFTAGFTPIPYKVFTVAGGVAAIPMAVFVAAAILSRGLRFFLVAGLIRWLGPRAKEKVERHFDQLSLAFVAVLVGGFLAVKTLVR